MESIPRGKGRYESVSRLVLCVLCNDQLSMSHLESDCSGTQRIVECSNRIGNPKILNGFMQLTAFQLPPNADALRLLRGEDGFNDSETGDRRCFLASSQFDSHDEI